MLASRLVNSKIKYSGQSSHVHLEIFFLIKRQNCECNVRNFRWIFFGMSPDILEFKVHVLQVAFTFGIGVKDWE